MSVSDALGSFGDSQTGCGDLVWGKRDYVPGFMPESGSKASYFFPSDSDLVLLVSYSCLGWTGLVMKT